MRSLHSDFEKHITVIRLIRQKEKIYVDAILEGWPQDEIKPIYFELRSLQTFLTVLNERIIFVKTAA